MDKDFKTEYNNLKQEFITSEENAKLLCMNLTDQRDRNEVLKNELRVLRQQAHEEKENNDLLDLKKELRDFRNKVECKLMSLEKNQARVHQENQQNHHNKPPPQQSTTPAKKQRTASSKTPQKTSKTPPSKKDQAKPPRRVAERPVSPLPHQSPTTSVSLSTSPKQSHTYRIPSKTGNTLRYTSNNPSTRELDPDENGRSNTSRTDEVDDVLEDKVRRIAKLRENRERRNRKTMIFGSSHAKSIKRDEFNEQLDMGTVDIFAYPGYTAEYITKYMLPHLVEECPHTVVLVAGGNDIPHRRATTKELEVIANHLIEGEKLCRDNYGVSRVCISSILPRVFAQLLRLSSRSLKYFTLYF